MVVLRAMLSSSEAIRLRTTTNPEEIMSTYSGNDSFIKTECRKKAMQPISDSVNLLVIAFAENVDGEWICKDVEELRKTGVDIQHITWVNDSYEHSFYIELYMNKHFKGRHTGLRSDLHSSIEKLKDVCKKEGTFNLVFFDYCNLLTPDHQTFWKKFIQSDLIQENCKFSITLQVHGRNYANNLKHKYGLDDPSDLLACDLDIECHLDKLDGKYWSNAEMLPSNETKKMDRVFSENVIHLNKNGKRIQKTKDLTWYDIPININDKDAMYFKSIFAISVASVLGIFSYKATLKNGEAFTYDAEHSNKMSLISFVRHDRSKGMTIAGLKMQRTKDIKEAKEQGKSVMAIAGIKAAYTRKINKIEKS